MGAWFPQIGCGVRGPTGEVSALLAEHGASLMKSNQKEFVRVSLDLSSKLNEKLEGLAEDIGVSKSDVLRRAIALLDFALDAKRQNKKFGVADADGRLTTEIVSL